MKEEQKIPAGYKSSPVGPIPEDWEVKKLGEVCPLQRGFDLPSDKLIPGEYPVVYSNGILNYHNTNMVKGPGVVTGRSGTIGKVTYIANDFWPHNTSLWVTSFNGNDVRYIFYLLQSLNLSKYASGSGVPTLNRNDLHIQKIAIPKLLEQRKIAEILGTWDKAIELQTVLIEKLTLRKKGLMQQLLTGKKRLKGFSEPWKTVLYGNMLQEICRNVEWDDNELYDLISVRRRSEGIFRRERLYGKDILTKGLGIVRDGDFIISKMQIVHGASALVTEEYDGAKVSGSYIVLIPRHKDSVCMEYFNYYSQTPRFYHQTFLSSYGVHIEKMTFDLSVFFTYGMSLPPYNEQIAIAKIIKTIDQEIEKEKQKLEALKQQKKGLMQQLLTGKKRVIIK